MRPGNSPAVQGLGLGVFTARAWVQSLVKELRSCKPCGMSKRKKKKGKEEREPGLCSWHEGDTGGKINVDGPGEWSPGRAFWP